MDGQAGNEDRQVEIDSGQAGEPKRDAQEVESVHGAISDRCGGCHVQTSSSGLAPALKICAVAVPLIFQAMLDIRLIREQPDLVKSRLATRGGEDAARIDEVLRVDGGRRKAETALQQLNADRKRL